MATTRFETVDEYIASFPPGVQEVLGTVRRAIREAVPGAEERISYQMPTYRFHGWLLYVGAFTKHYSLFCPHTQRLFDDFRERLSGYEVVKSTIKFPLDRPVPVALIHDIARYRAEENLRLEKPKRGRGNVPGDGARLGPLA